MAAQAQKQAQQDGRKSDSQAQQSHPPPFPRSVSPYISRRKSDTTATTAAAADDWRIHDSHQQRFFSTPQVGPTGSVTIEPAKKSRKSSGGKFSSLFHGLFKSKSSKSKKSDTDSGPISDPGTSKNSSPSWIRNVFHGHRKKELRTFSLDEGIAIGAQRNNCRNPERGMSPARYGDEDDEHCHGGSSGYSSESSGWKQTPRQTPAATRRGNVRAASVNSSNLKAFCLSPLVRASPNRHWSQKSGVPPETVTESRVPAKPHLSTATSFCKNRSRKLADIGRYSYNSNY